MTISQWTAYFEGLAREHKAVCHTDKSKHFFRAELEDFWQDLRSKVRFPAVMLESSLLDISADIPNDSAYRTLAFVVVDNCRQDDYKAITECQSRCEEIALSFLGRLKEDIHNDDLHDVRLASAHFEPLVNESMHYYGQRVEISISDRPCLFNPNDWQ